MALIASGLVGTGLNIEMAGYKTISFTLGMISTIVMFYIWPRSWLRWAQITPDAIGAAAAIALTIASIAVLVEFVLVNTTGLFLADIIPYSSDDLPFAKVLGDFIRPRGLSAEAGFTSMVLEMLLPLSMIYLRHHRIRRFVVLLVSIPAFILLFSAAGWFCVALAWIAIRIINGKAGVAVIVLTIMVAAIFAVAITYQDTAIGWVFDQIVGRKFTGLAGGSGGGPEDSGLDRAEVYAAAIQIFLLKPMGIGWGAISEMYSAGAPFPGLPVVDARGALSLYLEVLVSAGFSGFLFLAIFLIQKIRQIAIQRSYEAQCVLFALLTIMFHHAAILEFWFPMLWVLLAISDYFSSSNKHYFSCEPSYQKNLS